MRKTNQAIKNASETTHSVIRPLDNDKYGPKAIQEYELNDKEMTVYTMRVSLWPLRRPGRWGYLAESWMDPTPHFTVILKSIRGNLTNKKKYANCNPTRRVA